MSIASNKIEKCFWNGADSLRANSSLNTAGYSLPVLGLIFMCFADQHFSVAEQEMKSQLPQRTRSIGILNYQARGVMYVTDAARFSNLLRLPEDADTGMSSITRCTNRN